MKKIFASSMRSYYHYDSRKFNVGDIVKGNVYNIDEDIASVYEAATKLNDISSVLYMLDHEDDDYANTYKYGYQVEPVGKILKVQMDYSALMCQEEFKSCMTYYIQHNDIQHRDVPNVRKLYIAFMMESYLGDEDAKEMLEDAFGYSKSNKIEYICQSATVTKILQSKHNEECNKHGLSFDEWYISQSNDDGMEFIGKLEQLVREKYDVVEFFDERAIQGMQGSDLITIELADGNRYSFEFDWMTELEMIYSDGPENTARHYLIYIQQGINTDSALVDED